MQSLKSLKRQITIGKLLTQTQLPLTQPICSAPAKTQNTFGVPLNMGFSRFYKGKKKTHNDASNSFKTYTLE